MKACVDVYYAGSGATGACLTFREWTDDAPISEHVVTVGTVRPYVPGRFFERELPCILRVLSSLPDPVDLVVIDGYVWLGDSTRPGLGAHLYRALNGKTAVIGVAKTSFRGAEAEEVIRFGTRPLYISSVGIDRAIAAKWVQSMHGCYRIPTLLKRVDTLSRGRPAVSSARSLRH
jgi:deoxyribonuclease V